MEATLRQMADGDPGVTGIDSPALAAGAVSGVVCEFRLDLNFVANINHCTPDIPVRRRPIRNGRLTGQGHWLGVCTAGLFSERLLHLCGNLLKTFADFG